MTSWWRRQTVCKLSISPSTPEIHQQPVNLSSQSNSDKERKHHQPYVVYLLSVRLPQYTLAPLLALPGWGFLCASHFLPAGRCGPGPQYTQRPLPFLCGRYGLLTSHVCLFFSDTSPAVTLPLNHYAANNNYKLCDRVSITLTHNTDHFFFFML